MPEMITEFIIEVAKKPQKAAKCNELLAEMGDNLAIYETILTTFYQKAREKALKNGRISLNNGRIPLNNGRIPLNNGTISLNNGIIPLINGTIPLNNGIIHIVLLRK
jgi:hypothetical protein